MVYTMHMSVQFEEENNPTRFAGSDIGQDKPRTGSKMGDWLVKTGIAKDAMSANVILTIGAVLIFALSIYFFVYGFHLPR